MSNLIQIKEVTADGTAATLDITNIFSADYDIYKITSTSHQNSDTHTGLHLRFIDSGGSVITAGDYDYGRVRLKTDNNTLHERLENQSRITNQFGLADLHPEGSTTVTYVFNPFNSSTYTFTTEETLWTYTGQIEMRKGIGVLTQTASMTGIRAYLDANTITNKTKIRVYGIKRD